MPIKFKPATTTKLAYRYQLSCLDEMTDYFSLYQTILEQLPAEILKTEINRAFYQPTFLQVEEHLTIKTGYFLNYFVLLWTIVSQFPASKVGVVPLSIFEVKQEAISHDFLLFETLDVIARHARQLDCYELYKKLRPLINAEQCHALFNQSKLTQKLFYSLIDVPLSTVHRKKNSQLKQENHD